jgi:predicted O-linked N-acetylglucosamine transferase (SPINDLY family)
MKAEAAYKEGRIYEAIRLYEDALAGGLDRPAAQRTLGQLHLAARHYEAASQWLGRAAQAMPASAELLDQRAWALLGQGRMDQAQQLVAEALAGGSPAPTLNPLAKALKGSDAASLKVVADTLFETCQYELAREYYQRLSEVGPSARIYVRLGHICRTSGALHDAFEYIRKALAIDPDNADCLAYLGTLSILLGGIEEGVDMIRQAANKAPANAVIHSSLLFASHYLASTDRRGLFEEHRRWGQRHAPLCLCRTCHDNDPDPDRPLRIGYLCADFKMHSVSYNFEALLEKTDPRQVQNFGYGSVDAPDHVTRRIASKFHVYRSVYGLDDKAVADLVQRDRIDILASVAGHTAGHRMTVLAYKPAPLQVDYQSIDTSGIQQVDYRVTDDLLDPSGEESYYVEQLVHLGGGVVCYRPPEFAPEVGPLPSLSQGFVTFGSFNGTQKIHPGVVSLWAGVLRAVPSSRLMMKCTGGDDPHLAGHYLRLFDQEGISRDRIRIRGWLRPESHLDPYHEVDIALDTVPFNGCVTTLEGLWMGVPVVTLKGRKLVSRVGLTILSRVGLERLVASTPRQYVELAAGLARNPAVLARIRSSLRSRMAASPLCDADRYAREMEAAYRQMWRRWCQEQKSEPRTQNSELRTHSSGGASR